MKGKCKASGEYNQQCEDMEGNNVYCVASWRECPSQRLQWQTIQWTPTDDTQVSGLSNWDDDNLIH